MISSEDRAERLRALPPAMTRGRDSARAHLLFGIGGFCSFLFIWDVLARHFSANPVLLPPPGDVGRAALELARSGALATDVLASVQRVGCGFLLAAGAGVGLGLLLAVRGRISDFLHPLLECLRPVPPIAWIPLAILWFGLGDASSYFIVAMGAFFPIFLSTYEGIRNVDPLYGQAARCLGAQPRRVVLEVLLPAALPSILTGLRVGAGVGWMAVIAAELVVATSGLGYMIQLNRSLLETSRVIVGMALIGLLGYLMSTVLALIQRLLTPWQPRRERGR